jgi:hypothetical protein
MSLKDGRHIFHKIHHEISPIPKFLVKLLTASAFDSFFLSLSYIFTISGSDFPENVSSATNMPQIPPDKSHNIKNNPERAEKSNIPLYSDFEEWRVRIQR